MMNFTRRVFSLPLRAFACVLVLMPLALAAQSDEALVEEVRRGQASSRALLEYYRMDYRASFQHNTQAQSQLSTEMRQLEVRKSRDGDLLRLDVSEQNEGEGASGAFSEAYSSYLAVNDTEAAVWSARDGAVSGELAIYRHTSPAAMQREAADELERIHGLDLVDFAFGFMTQLSNGPDEAARAYGRLAGLGAFEAALTQQGGRELIEVRYLRSGETVLTAMIDPAQGYATTLLKMHMKDPIDGSEVRFDYEISVREVVGGVWVPDRFRATEWTGDQGGTVESSATAEVLNAELEPDFAPEIFQWQGLGYPGENVHLYDTSGNGVTMATNDRRLRTTASGDSAPATPETGKSDTPESEEPLPHTDDDAPAPEISQVPDEPVDEVIPEPATQGPSTMVVLLGAALLLSAAGAVAWKMR